MFGDLIFFLGKKNNLISKSIQLKNLKKEVVFLYFKVLIQMWFKLSYFSKLYTLEVLGYNFAE
jgi:hypothetical protein